VGFSELTSAGQLRHARYLGLRRDKEASAVVRERPE
jgi:bifunctional non-homologous end joining protein LigD